ncbi:MAG TPA: CBS domain-containing protein, partial [Polyangiales bacterium]
ILWEDDLGALPVVNDEGQPIAIITDRDVAVAAYTQGRPLSQIQVQIAMSQELHTAHVSDKLSTAERSMRMHQVRRLPVVDESTRLVGVISLADIAQLESRAGEQLSTDAGAALAAVSRPRRTSIAAPEEVPVRTETRPLGQREQARVSSTNLRASAYAPSSQQARR